MKHSTKHPDSDLGTPELRQRRIVAEEAIDPRSSEGRSRRARVIDQTPLDRYRLRREITGEQFEAGERLRSDWWLSGASPRLIPAYAETIKANGGDIREAAEDAHRRFTAAMRAVGMVLSPVLAENPQSRSAY